MTVPDWVQDAVFYQIFPDRFANGDPENDPQNVKPWGSSPTIWGFQGGDFQGMIQKFDYLLDLGITAIYLNPIFLATSNHRYNTTDYYHIDEKLGTLEDFRSFLNLAHRASIKVVLDGVFNHCGRGFFAFNDILENQEHSPYLDWFHIKHLPVDAFTYGEARDYLGWWGMKHLPKFNTDNPQVRCHILDVARYWIEFGIDGWRLDVPNEINDDTFWAEFRSVVKSANPDAYLLGEIWTADAHWVGDSHFDGLMNYPVRDALLRLLYAGTLNVPDFYTKMKELLNFYPRENAYAMFVPLGSHDTERILSKLEDNIQKTKLAFLFQFAYPGAPSIYYGDEIGLTGGKDPECRKAFPWDTRQWNMELRDWARRLISLRKDSAVLRRGDCVSICADLDPACCVFIRRLGTEQILVIMNASAEARQVNIPIAQIGWGKGQMARSLLTGSEFKLENGFISIRLEPWSGDWLA